MSLGCDIPALLLLLEKSWGQSTMLLRSGPMVQSALAHGTSLDHPSVAESLQQPSAAPLRNFSKDLDFVLEAAAANDLVLPSTTCARATVRKASVEARN